MIGIFLDESGTHTGSAITMVCAIACPNVRSLEARISGLVRRFYSDDSYWPDVRKREAFKTEGFHFTVDSETINTLFLNELSRMDYRGHVAYSRGNSGVAGTDLLINMYYSLVRNICLRYRNEEILFVFEQESRMNSLYGRIVGAVMDDLEKNMSLVIQASVRIGSKSAPILSVADYVMAVTGNALTETPAEYEKQRFNAGLSTQIAYLVDFDRGVHKSARGGVDLLCGPRGRIFGARVASVIVRSLTS